MLSQRLQPPATCDWPLSCWATFYGQLKWDDRFIIKGRSSSQAKSGGFWRNSQGKLSLLKIAQYLLRISLNENWTLRVFRFLTQKSSAFFALLNALQIALPTSFKRVSQNPLQTQFLSSVYNWPEGIFSIIQGGWKLSALSVAFQLVGLQIILIFHVLYQPWWQPVAAARQQGFNLSGRGVIKGFYYL